MEKGRGINRTGVTIAIMLCLVTTAGCQEDGTTDEEISTFEFTNQQVQTIDTQDVIALQVNGNSNVITVSQCKEITKITVDGSSNVITVSCNVTTEELVVNGNSNVLTFTKAPSSSEDNGASNVITTSSSGGGGGQGDVATSDEVVYEFHHMSLGLNMHGNEAFEVSKIFKSIRLEVVVNEITPVSQFGYRLVDSTGKVQYDVAIQGRDDITYSNDLPFVIGRWVNTFEISSFDGEAHITITGLA